MEVENIKPYEAQTDKTGQVEKMFDSIAPAYDFMNNAMTAGLCRIWRNRALGRLHITAESDVLDVATGTGDVAFHIYSKFHPRRIVGVDLSAGMLDVARKRLHHHYPQAAGSISFETGNCLDLRFPDDSFDIVTVAYGVRNFEHLDRGYTELYRVLRPGGTLCVIELSEPQAALPKMGYSIYSRKVIPFLGRLISGDSRAYSYLPESIAAAPQRDDMTALMIQAGFSDARWESLTFGVVCIYIAHKR